MLDLLDVRKEAETSHAGSFVCQGFGERSETSVHFCDITKGGFAALCFSSHFLKSREKVKEGLRYFQQISLTERGSLLFDALVK